jgi:ABC-2 type transport system ATP-binding protein
VTLDGGPPEALVAELGALDAVERVEQVAGAGPPGGGDGRRELRARLYLTGEAPALVAPVAALVARHKGQLTDVTIGAPSLEDVFITLTGRALR